MADYRPGLAPGRLETREDDRLRVIVFSRDLSFAEMRRLRLAVDGYDTSVVTTAGVPARLMENPPDLIFLDLRHRGDELALYRELRANRQLAVPIVLFSHCTALELAEEGVLSASFDFVICPVGDQTRKGLSPFTSN